MKKKLDNNYTRMLRAILKKSWRQHPSKQQLYGLLWPITKTLHVRWTRHAGYYRSSKDELISDALLQTLSHGRAKARWPARTYIQQLSADTGCSPKTCRKQWTIEKGVEKESRISVLMVRHDELFLFHEKSTCFKMNTLKWLANTLKWISSNLSI